VRTTLRAGVDPVRIPAFQSIAEGDRAWGIETEARVRDLDVRSPGPDGETVAGIPSLAIHDDPVDGDCWRHRAHGGRRIDDGDAEERWIPEPTVRGSRHRRLKAAIGFGGRHAVGPSVGDAVQSARLAGGARLELVPRHTKDPAVGAEPQVAGAIVVD